MAYTTYEDVDSRLGTLTLVQLTDDEANGSANANRVNEARDAAEAELNSFLAARYATPIDLVAYPELAGLLRGLTLDLVEYRLHARRPPVPPDVSRRAAEVRAWLAGIVAGTTHLPAARAVVSDSTRAPLAEITGPERIFTRESLQR